MSYREHNDHRPITLTGDGQQVRDERLRFSLAATLAMMSLGLLIVEAVGTENVVGYAAALWDALPRWPAI
jgi:hypothetical protein